MNFSRASRSVVQAWTCVVLPLLSLGCITLETSGTSTGQMMEDITTSQFYKDAAIFYPDIQVQDPAKLPELNESELSRLQVDLSDYLEIVHDQHEIHSDQLARMFRDGILPTADAKLILTDRDIPEALTSANGEIAIDTRVIQSTLRSSLLTTFSVEVMLHRIKTDNRRGEKSYTLAEESIAIDTYLAARERLHLTPGRSHFGDLFTDSESNGERGELDWFDLTKLTNKLSNVDVRYDVQLLFLLAHEYGHIVLGHFGENPVLMPPDDDQDACSHRRALEGAADVYAILLVAMSTRTNLGAELMGGASLLDGLDTFFTYAYDYAGFSEDGGTRGCNNYPPPERRLGYTGRIYAALRSGELDLNADSE